MGQPSLRRCYVNGLRPLTWDTAVVSQWKCENNCRAAWMKSDHSSSVEYKTGATEALEM